MPKDKLQSTNKDNKLKASYWSKLCHKTYQDTKDSSLQKPYWLTLLLLVLSATTSAIFDQLHGHESMNNIIYSIGVGLATFVVLFLIAFVIRLLLVTPKKIYIKVSKEYQHDKDQWSNQIQEYQNSFMDKRIQVIYDSLHSHCYEKLDNERTQYRLGMRSYGIDVTINNAGICLRKIEICDLKLVKKQDVSGIQPGLLRPTNRKIIQNDGITLHASRDIGQYVDVFTWNSNQSEIEICYQEDVPSFKLKLSTTNIYAIHFETQGTNTTPTAFVFFIRIGKKNQLLVETGISIKIKGLEEKK